MSETTELLAAVMQLRAELAETRQELQRLRQELSRQRQATGDLPCQDLIPFPIPPPSEQLVTLDQMAAMVRLQKSSMWRYREQMPAPRIRGRGGRASLWAWADARPWLEREFGRSLPENFPSINAG